jgi:hypothetical protein
MAMTVPAVPGRMKTRVTGEVDWPTAAVLIAVIIAVMVIASTYIGIARAEALSAASRVASRRSVSGTGWPGGDGRRRP